MQRAAATLAFLTLFGALTAVLLFAASRDVDHPTAAEAFFAKYQQRAPALYASGHIDMQTFDAGGRTVTNVEFDTNSGRVYSVTYENGVRTKERLMPPSGSTAPVQVRLMAAEADIKATTAGIDLVHADWELEPASVRFRNDPRAVALGARQLIIEFRSRQPNLTDLTQLLTIDAESYKLIFAESTWGKWDPERRDWAYQQTRRLSNINEPVTIPASAP